MPTVYASNGASWTIPALEQTIIRAHELVSVDGKTTLQTTNNNIDQAHLILHGALPGNEKYIICKNGSNTTQFSVNSVGNVFSNGRSVNQELEELSTLSAANYGTLAVSQCHPQRDGEHIGQTVPGFRHGRNRI